MNFFEVRDWFADRLCDFLREKDEGALQELKAVIDAVLYRKKVKGLPLPLEEGEIDPFMKEYLREKAERYESFLKNLGDFEPVGEDVEKNVLMAKRLFKSKLFFEVHELLEHVWMGEFGSLRKFLQALIQVGAACYHFENFNERGFRGLLENALELLEGYSGVVCGIDTELLRSKIKLALVEELPPEEIL